MGKWLRKIGYALAGIGLGVASIFTGGIINPAYLWGFGGSAYLIADQFYQRKRDKEYLVKHTYNNGALECISSITDGGTIPKIEDPKTKQEIDYVLVKPNGFLQKEMALGNGDDIILWRDGDYVGTRKVIIPIPSGTGWKYKLPGGTLTTLEIKKKFEDNKVYSNKDESIISFINKGFISKRRKVHKIDDSAKVESEANLWERLRRRYSLWRDGVGGMLKDYNLASGSHYLKRLFWDTTKVIPIYSPGLDKGIIEMGPDLIEKLTGTTEDNFKLSINGENYNVKMGDFQGNYIRAERETLEGFRKIIKGKMRAKTEYISNENIGTLEEILSAKA